MYIIIIIIKQWICILFACLVHTIWQVGHFGRPEINKFIVVRSCCTKHLLYMHTSVSLPLSHVMVKLNVHTVQLVLLCVVSSLIFNVLSTIQCHWHYCNCMQLQTQIFHAQSTVEVCLGIKYDVYVILQSMHWATKAPQPQIVAPDQQPAAACRTASSQDGDASEAPCKKSRERSPSPRQASPYHKAQRIDMTFSSRGMAAVQL